MGSLHRESIKALHDWAKMLLDIDRLDLARIKCLEATQLLEKKKKSAHQLILDLPDEGSGSTGVDDANTTTSRVGTGAEAGDEASLLTDIKLTLAKILRDQGKLADAIRELSVVQSEYSHRYGSQHPKVYNALGETGYTWALRGHSTRGGDIMQTAADGLVNVCAMSDTHPWVIKLKNRLSRQYAEPSGTSRCFRFRTVEKQRYPRVIVFDCGTNETKGILCTVVEGRVMTLEVGPKLEPMMTYLKDGQAKFSKLINDVAEVEHVARIFIGMTAWFRQLSHDDQLVARRVIDQTAKKAAAWTVAPIDVPHEREAFFEAVAVKFATTRNNLPPTDLLLASGGGSIQISTDIESNGMRHYLIDEGFVKSRDLLLEQGVGEFSNVRAHWDGVFRKFMNDNSGFEVKSDQRVVAISGCVHAAHASGIVENKDILCGLVLQKFEAAAAGLIRAVEARDREHSMPDKGEAVVLANLALQIEMFNATVHPRSRVVFGRNWLVESLHFRTTWTMGWYLDTCNLTRLPRIAK
eukprot:c12913_g2_i7.p1 GENE.c12913_g2_i7~~c12913_g2_i7.p1  ORF type:complete len:523 (+),score=162.57 c12913_g2_i7:58-1626(+)